MSLKSKVGVLAICLSTIASSGIDAFFGFGDCWTDTDCIWDSIRCRDWGATIDATGGYRYDRITCLINAYDPPGTFISSDDLKAKNLQVWEWGLRARVRLGNLYAKAWGTFGVIPFGNYTETGTGATGLSSQSRTDVRHGKVEDASFGAGYLFGVTDWLSLAPVGGWSYNYQRIKLKHAKTDGVSDPTLNGTSYTNRWQGPWAGFEGVTEFGCLLFNIGYEYHWAHWHAVWKLSGADQIGGAFSDKRHSNKASGNVVYFNTFWNAWDDLDAGVLLKYQYWRATNGQMVPLAGSFAAVGLGADEVNKVSHATWQSFEIQLSLGYTF
jgi:hypothetical protein